MNSPTVSIVCPVYNAEKYISRCIDSILSQTLDSWELILVDDGSTDSSGIICDEYAEADSRIQAIHKSNGGVAAARLAGVDAARGEYLIHADADDYVEPAMLEEMVSEIKRQGVDILVADFIVDNDSGVKEIGKQLFLGSSSKDLAEAILLQKLHGSLCNKIVKQSSYRSAAPCFFPGVNFCEDVLIWVQLSRFNLSVGYLPKAYYHYVKNEDSITRDFSRTTLEACKKYIGKLCSFVPENSPEVRLAKEMVKYNAFCSMILLDKEIKELYPEIKTYGGCSSYLKPIYGLGFCGHQKIAHHCLNAYLSIVLRLTR